MKDDTVEVLVRIPKHDYDYILGQGDTRGTSHLAEAICNGIVLPKGHGRLGDLDSLYQDISNGIKAGNYEEGYEDYGNINDMDDCVDTVRFAETIIEADKEVENDG